MTHDSISPAEARAALNNIDATRAQLAAAGQCPPWRHAAFGAVMGLLVLGIGLSSHMQVAMLAFAMGGVAAIGASDRKRYGVFINGFRKGATWLPTAGLIVSMLALFVIQHRLSEAGVASWIPIAVAIVAAGVGALFSVWWNRVFRREMESAA